MPRYIYKTCDKPKTYIRKIGKKNGIELTTDVKEAFSVSLTITDHGPDYVLGFSNALCMLTGIPVTPLYIQ